MIDMEQIKRINKMNGKEYQELAMRTYDGYAMNRLSSNVMSATFYETAALLNGVLGLTGEAGEVSELIKKGIFHEKGIDKEYLEKELGDVMWYIALICHACGFNLDEIMQINIDKLKKRYPDGFDISRTHSIEVKY